MKKNVVVLGGGLGGLSAAISLAADPGLSITIVEKNQHLGGKLNVLKKDGFSFDLGPSIFTMPYIFKKLFDLHGRKMEDYVELVPVTPHWRNFFEGGRIIDLEPQPEDMRKAPTSLGERDIRELKDFLEYSKGLYDFSDEVYFQKQSETLTEILKKMNPVSLLRRSDYFHTMDQGVRKRISDPDLQDVLNFFVKYVGSSPYEAPAVLNLLPYIQWEFGLWYVKGGMFALSEGLERLIRELGIQVRTGTEVTGMERDGGEIKALQTVQGEMIPVNLVVSDMEVIPFYERISKEPEKRIQPYRKKYGPACSGFALHLGVDREYEILRHHNFFHSASPRKHFDKLFRHPGLTDDPTIYLVAPMKTDPSQGPEGGEIIKILPHIPVVQKDSPFTPEDYEAYESHVLDKLERMGLTDLRKHIVTRELWTPETIEEMYYSNQGAIYGVVSDRKANLGFKTPKRSPYYGNLFFAGGSTNPGGGMPMVVLSGQQVAEQIRECWRR